MATPTPSMAAPISTVPARSSPVNGSDDPPPVELLAVVAVGVELLVLAGEAVEAVELVVVPAPDPEPPVLVLAAAATMIFPSM